MGTLEQAVRDTLAEARRGDPEILEAMVTRALPDWDAARWWRWTNDVLAAHDNVALTLALAIERLEEVVGLK